MNQINLIGRIASILELKESKKSGKKYMLFNIAVKDDFDYDKTIFLPVLIFGKKAEWVVEKLSTGTLIAITGKGDLVSWKDESNNYHQRFKVFCDKITCLESKSTTESRKDKDLYLSDREMLESGKILGFEEEGWTLEDIHERMETK